jgi:hypothetical protein
MIEYRVFRWYILSEVSNTMGMRWPIYINDAKYIVENFYSHFVDEEGNIDTAIIKCNKLAYRDMDQSLRTSLILLQEH